MFLPSALDAAFPYICFFYGAMMTIVLNLPVLVRLADERLPSDLVSKWKSHRSLAQVCLWVGAAWILQNLWVS